MKSTRHLALLLLISFVLLVGFAAAPGSAQTGSPASANRAVTRARARNVILFLGDGMGLSTVNAASIYGYKRPGALFMQHMKYLGWSDTSSANNWVTDSAAGMTAIITGHKTLNNVLSQSPEGAVVGKEDGARLKTLLEYAEEKGLSTGIITNDEVTGATPAACYSHVNSRNSREDIAAQFLKPAFGNGPEALIGPDQGYFAAKEDGGKRADSRNLADEAQKLGYQRFDSADALVPATLARNTKVLGLFHGRFKLEPVLEKTIAMLSRNPRGYFLVVEWDSHMKTAKQSLENALELDGAAARTRKLADSRNTLIVVTADHSYDLRFPQGAKLDDDILSVIRIDGHHTAEEVLIAADGPGANRVRGFMKNTDIFAVMKAAFGW